MKLLDPSAWFSRKRHVLIHAHQFKNAGTTLDWSLQRSFPEAFFDHRDDDAMRGGADYLGSWLEDHRRVKVLTSHWITFPLPESERLKLHLLLLFRDPLERARSVYNFERRQLPAETPGSIKAKVVGFLDYVRWNLEPAQGPAIRNFHTRYCSGEYLGDNLEQKYEQALVTIESTPLLGLVHRYDESMVLFEHLLRPFFPDIDLSYQVLNTTGGDLGTLQQRRDQVLAELGPIMDDYRAANEFDLRLFQRVEQRFDQELEQVPELEARMRDLKRRCERIRA